MSPGIVYALIVWIGGAAVVAYMARERGQNVLIFFYVRQSSSLSSHESAAKKDGTVL